MFKGHKWFTNGLIAGAGAIVLDLLLMYGFFHGNEHLKEITAVSATIMGVYAFGVVAITWKD